MTADNRDHPTFHGPASEPVSLRTRFIQKAGVATGWRTAVAVGLGLAILIVTLAYFGSTA